MGTGWAIMRISHYDIVLLPERLNILKSEHSFDILKRNFIFVGVLSRWCKLIQPYIRICMGPIIIHRDETEKLRRFY